MSEPFEVLSDAVSEGRRFTYTQTSNEGILSPSDKGCVHELIVAVDLMKRGFQVYKSMSPASSCDLVIEKGERLIRVEVSTCRLRKSPTLNKTIIYHCKAGKFKENVFDILALVDVDSGKIYYSPEP